MSRTHDDAVSSSETIVAYSNKYTVSPKTGHC